MKTKAKRRRMTETQAVALAEMIANANVTGLLYLFGRDEPKPKQMTRMQRKMLANIRRQAAANDLSYLLQETPKLAAAVKTPTCCIPRYENLPSRRPVPAK